MATPGYPSDMKIPYVMEYTQDNTLPSGAGTSSVPINSLTGYQSEKQQGYLSDDSYDPTNVGVRRTNHNLEREASYISDGPSGNLMGGKRLTYSEDDLNHPSNVQPTDDSPETPLVRNVSQKPRAHFEDLEYADPYNKDTPAATKEKPLSKFFAGAKYPLAQRIEDKKRGIGRQKYPFVVYGLTLAMAGVFIYELVLNQREQGSPISLKPVINPMLGPSSSALVNLGARFPPCMKLVSQVPPSTPLGCMNNTANPVTSVCTVEDLCGFGGFHNEAPNQWFRFITAIFLHAGFVHILINMFAQLTLSAQIEREMGSGGFFITYFAAGIFGNVLGGNFSLVGIPSIGASGAIFGTVAVTWVDLVAHWKYHYRPVRKLIFMTIELLIGFAIGYIPFVDNFAHIGGFVMGLLVGTVFYPVISVTKRHRFITWSFRVAAIPLAVILYIVLTRNFYTSDPYAACAGCRYLSCIPSSANNRCQGTGLSNSS
ncbi:hypothetical protein B0H34DRAFT_50608 [Crassisporium funariophilum]|nr:hypothetical protein B0H34DRAFT_50608 [Crassisporium funariophilum]